MGIVRFAICFIALTAFGAIALMIAHPYLLKMAARSQAEKDYLRLVSEAKTEIYVSSPELIERIVIDKRLAETITKVNLVGPDGKSMDFASLLGLPNIASVDIYYCHGAETVIATLNKMTGLKEVKFFLCFPNEMILQEIDSTSLIQIAIHSHQPLPNADKQVSKTKERLPNCTIRLTND